MFGAGFKVERARLAKRRSLLYFVLCGALVCSAILFWSLQFERSLSSIAFASRSSSPALLPSYKKTNSNVLPLPLSHSSSFSSSSPSIVFIDSSTPVGRNQCTTLSRDLTTQVTSPPNVTRFRLATSAVEAESEGNVYGQITYAYAESLEDTSASFVHVEFERTAGDGEEQKGEEDVQICSVDGGQDDAGGRTFQITFGSVMGADVNVNVKVTFPHRWFGPGLKSFEVEATQMEHVFAGEDEVVADQLEVSGRSIHLHSAKASRMRLSVSDTLIVQDTLEIRKSLFIEDSGNEQARDLVVPRTILHDDDDERGDERAESGPEITIDKRLGSIVIPDLQIRPRLMSLDQRRAADGGEEGRGSRRLVVVSALTAIGNIELNMTSLDTLSLSPSSSPVMATDVVVRAFTDASSSVDVSLPPSQFPLGLQREEPGIEGEDAQGIQRARPDPGPWGATPYVQGADHAYREGGGGGRGGSAVWLVREGFPILHARSSA